MNTDAIDNSAGVDSSDHEVNIKILLRAAIVAGQLAQVERDPLLASMTDEVVELVLADNEAQTNALEIAAVEAPGLVGVHARQMERLEQTGLLDRALERLPDAKALQERHAAGLGLTAPELAVLLAFSSICANSSRPISPTTPTSAKTFTTISRFPRARGFLT